MGHLHEHWLFVAAEAELPEPGDYVTVEVGLLGDHRAGRRGGGARVPQRVQRPRIPDPRRRRGSVGNLVCPYHHWTYNVDGWLLHAESQPATFDRSRFGLKPVHVRNVAGLVFICLADEPPTDSTRWRRASSPTSPLRDGAHKVAHQIDIVEDGNWKLVMENNRECYHCDGHPELISAYFPLHAYTTNDVPPRCAGSGNVRDGYRAPSGGVCPAGFPRGRHA